MELSSSNIKQFLEILKKLHFLKNKSFSHILGNENPEKLFKFQETFYISGSNFPSSRNKKNPLLKSFLYFGKLNSLVPSIKNFLYFRKRSCGEIQLWGS